jgi:hypothetical protein
MPNASIVGVLAIVAIILSGFGSYYFTATPLNAQVSSYQTSVSSYESVVSSMSAHPSTTTTTETLTSTLTTTSTYSTTYTTLQTVTTTRSIYPPSSSSYVLTFVSGNATYSSGGPACSVNYYVDATYEMNQSIPNSGVVVWIKYPDGEVAHAVPTMFVNQAYLTLDASFFYQFNACGGNWYNLTTWVTDNSNNVLSSTTYLIVS